MKNWFKSGTSFVAMGVLLISATTPMWAQQVAPAPSTDAKPSPAAQQPAFTPQTAAATAEEEQVVKLSPFEVSATKDDTYTAATTLAGRPSVPRRTLPQSLSAWVTARRSGRGRHG